MKKQRILVLCTGNSCRSQMAEGYLNHLYPERVQAFSAGSAPSGSVHPYAVQVMAEAGIDISRNESRHLKQFLDQPFDLVLTVCGNAAENCPVFPSAAKRIHHSFDDPADAAGSEAEILAVFRRVRDEIKVWLEAIQGA